MRTVYIQEWEEYSRSDLLDILENDYETLERLLKYSLVDLEKDKYQVKYVGVIIISDFVINCYPKYVPEEIAPEDHFPQVLKVIKKYKKLHENIDYQNEELDEISFNQLSMMIFFLEDYYEFGVYTNTRRVFKINGNGDIDWNRTINNSTPLIKDKLPFYIDLYTKYNINDMLDYFRLLHEYIITTCSKHLEEVGLLELFDLTPVELSDKSLDDFGEKSFILNRLTKELNVEFNSHKRKLLESMHTFILEENSFSNKNFLTVYGTSSYHVIWEKMCREIFDDKLNEKLGVLMPNLNEKYDSEKKLIEIIEKPKWYLDGKEFKADDTFRPDIVTFYRDEFNHNYFVIFDAKYYNIKLERNKISGQPGIESVSKQYFYQLAYNEFIGLHNFKGAKNVFLLPGYDDEPNNWGCVRLNIFHESLKLENIQVIKLPAREVNQLYLEGEKMEIGEWFK